MERCSLLQPYEMVFQVGVQLVGNDDSILWLAAHSGHRLRPLAPCTALRQKGEAGVGAAATELATRHCVERALIGGSGR